MFEQIKELISETRNFTKSYVEAILLSVNEVLSELPTPTKIGYQYFFDNQGRKQIGLFPKDGPHNDILKKASDLLNQLLVDCHSNHLMVTFRWVNIDHTPQVVATDIVLSCHSNETSISQIADQAKDLMHRATPEKVEAAHQ
jgi:hypothetical protein